MASRTEVVPAAWAGVFGFGILCFLARAVHMLAPIDTLSIHPTRQRCASGS